MGQAMGFRLRRMRLRRVLWIALKHRVPLMAFRRPVGVVALRWSLRGEELGRYGPKYDRVVN